MLAAPAPDFWPPAPEPVEDAAGVSSAIQAVVDDALAGRGRVLLVANGVADAAALDRLAVLAAARGAVVLRRRCPGDGLPFAAWGLVEAADGPTGGVERLVALARALDAVRGRPLLVVIEEAHLADRASILALELVAALLPGWPLAVVATYDAAAPGEWLAAALPGLAAAANGTPADTACGEPEPTVRIVPPPRTATFRREGDYWTIAYGDRLVRMHDALGLRYLAVLLRQPGVRLHVSDLLAVAGRRVPQGQNVAAATERVRVAVTKAIGAAIRRIARELPELSRHLMTAVRRGYFCTYAPDAQHPVRWHT
jgi:hypothetical protein